MTVLFWTGEAGDIYETQISNINSIDFQDDHILMYRKNKDGIMESIGTVYFEDLISIEEGI